MAVTRDNPTHVWIRKNRACRSELHRSALEMSGPIYRDAHVRFMANMSQYHDLDHDCTNTHQV